VTADERDEQLYLADIKDAIDRVLRYTHTGREAFFADPMAQDAVVRNVEIIGEATRGVSEAIKRAHPEIPWRDISDMRNKVIHDYFRVDLAVVWDVVEKDLPPLRTQVEALLKDE
jgi:uncharacterized protein with HEPN domain